MGKWTVWMCCGEFDTYDNKEDAFGWAHAASESDGGHRPQAVEGPNGEDLTDEFEAYSRAESRRSYEAWKARSDDYRSRLIGSVEVRSPSGEWCAERVYSEESRDRLLAEMRDALGVDRVRFVPV